MAFNDIALASEKLNKQAKNLIISLDFIFFFFSIEMYNVRFI